MGQVHLISMGCGENCWDCQILIRKRDPMHTLPEIMMISYHQNQIGNYFLWGIFLPFLCIYSSFVMFLRLINFIFNLSGNVARTWSIYRETCLMESVTLDFYIYGRTICVISTSPRFLCPSHNHSAMSFWLSDFVYSTSFILELGVFKKNRKTKPNQTEKKNRHLFGLTWFGF